MPVFFDSDPDAEAANSSDRCITIGLVNNMGDEALKPTERQFISLLNAASDGMLIRLSLYTLPGVSRSSAVARHVRSHYSDIDNLWESELDGLIVTGREPLAARLEDEPYWGSFTRLVGWAGQNATSTVWSCLAAHAAVLHLDGIERIKRGNKLFGIFGSARATPHALTADTASDLQLPHSRWNGIPQDALLDCGYQVLTRSAEAGVDTFIKQGEKLFVFFQGHPEYSSDTLLREYRRDVGRYFRGETGQYPSLPCNYFEAGMASALDALRAKAMTTGDPLLLTQVAGHLENCAIKNTWQANAVTLYRNWLKYLYRQKQGLSRGATLIADLEPVW
jgi:homoserine O-succinyltransferase/O-acetyltransferase